MFKKKQAEKNLVSAKFGVFKLLWWCSLSELNSPSMYSKLAMFTSSIDV